MPTYLVSVGDERTIRLVAGDISDARASAKRLFGAPPKAVSRQQAYRHCARCDCKPCMGCPPVDPQPRSFGDE